MHRMTDPSLVKLDAFVDGAWRGARSGARFAVTNPADGRSLGEVADLDVEDVRAAVEAAHRAQADWRARPAKARAALLSAWYDLVMAAQEDLALLMTLEQGKPLAEARSEIAYGAAFIQWYAEEARRIYGETIPAPDAGKRILVTREPVGVVSAITPWNFPMAMITRKCAPALATGCAIVIKPSEETPLSALALAELALRAGLPAGVFNIVTSTRSQEVGLELTQNPLIRKFSFTGSTAVGKRLMAQCATTVKKVSLELGGNAPFIVFDDADLDAAVQGSIAAKFRNMGQTCVSANRFLVQRGVFEAFAAKLAARAGQLTLGSGDEAGVEQGPLINARAVDKVERLLGEAVQAGAKVRLGGGRDARGGGFFAPTVLSGVTPGMAIAREEIFGPVAALTVFTDEAEAIALANDTQSGLAAYVYTRDIGRVMRVSGALEYGMVAVNDGVLSNEAAPFGGVKESGLGREGSRHGIDDYLEIKYTLLGGL